MDEKRKHIRVKKKLKSEVHSSDGITYSTIMDLSMGGLYISTPEPVAKGQTVELFLYVPGEEPINIQGVIRWNKPEETAEHRAGMGIEFTSITDMQAKTIKKIF